MPPNIEPVALAAMIGTTGSKYPKAPPIVMSPMAAPFFPRSVPAAAVPNEIAKNFKAFSPAKETKGSRHKESL
jgi:hypothetical protein